MRLLDLFCGAGGAAMGYHRAGFEVVGVDHKPQKHYPFEFHCADAFAFLEKHGHEFDVIHASPPCQGYSSMKTMWNAKAHPLLIDPMRKQLQLLDKPWIIENVIGAKMQAALLCGFAFGRNVHRHRYFETSFFFLAPGCGSTERGFTPSQYGNHRTVAHASRKVKDLAREVFDVEWMHHGDEITNAIPPAYTEWIGRRLLETL